MHLLFVPSITQKQRIENPDLCQSFCSFGVWDCVGSKRKDIAILMGIQYNKTDIEAANSQKGTGLREELE